MLIIHITSTHGLDYATYVLHLLNVSTIIKIIICVTRTLIIRTTGDKFVICLCIHTYVISHNTTTRTYQSVALISLWTSQALHLWLMYLVPSESIANILSPAQKVPPFPPICKYNCTIRRTAHTCNRIHLNRKAGQYPVTVVHVLWLPVSRIGL